MEIFVKIWPVILVVLVVFMVKEGLSFYTYLKNCQLHEAAKTGNIDKVRKLLEAGYPVDALDTRFGLTPLHFAVRNNRVEVARLLIEKGASFTQSSIHGITALDWTKEYLDPKQRDALLHFADRDNPTDDA